MRNRIICLLICILIVPSINAQTPRDEYSFDENEIFNIFDYPKLYFNKLFYCQSEYGDARTYKIDLYSEQTTVIIYQPQYPDSNTIFYRDMLNINEGKNTVRFSLDRGAHDISKNPKWTLDKSNLSASFVSWYDAGKSGGSLSEWMGPFEYKCYKELPPSLSKFK
tara:strand:- start:1440 stop:1934 length:495 start_codon:yes stop_codon:yes gene_type:complete